MDPDALVQQVLRESYLQTMEDLRFYAEKVRSFNERRKALRAYLAALRKFRVTVITAARKRGVNMCRCDKEDVAILAKLFPKHAHSYDVTEVERELCIPARVPAFEVKSVARLDAAIAHWEDQLNTIGDDAQLANVDLQNWLQKQQQTLQMMSNISKLLHDATMSTIRKIGG